MCNQFCVSFLEKYIRPIEIEGKHVLEVGSRNVNGSVRPSLVKLNPASYIGVDIQTGEYVDKIVNANELVKEFGEQSFDVVISTEMVEHVWNWIQVFNQMKLVTKDLGYIYITTRNKNSSQHDYPKDYWRYEKQDMIDIFNDFTVINVEDDESGDGTFVKARKWMGRGNQLQELESIKLFHIIHKQRMKLSETTE
jgi:2-polyprenyl-3-methyl-5-hydroxy-6-metoxy-1,4-benzoquinol methylase